MVIWCVFRCLYDRQSLYLKCTPCIRDHIDHCVWTLTNGQRVVLQLQQGNFVVIYISCWSDTVTTQPGLTDVKSFAWFLSLLRKFCPVRQSPLIFKFKKNENHGLNVNNDIECCILPWLSFCLQFMHQFNYSKITVLMNGELLLYGPICGMKWKWCRSTNCMPISGP